MEARGQLPSQFSPSTFMWVPGIELRWLYPLSQHAIPYAYNLHK